MSHTATPEQRETAHTASFRSNTERDAYVLALEQRLAALERIVAQMNVFAPLSPAELAEMAARK